MLRNKNLKKYNLLPLGSIIHFIHLKKIFGWFATTGILLAGLSIIYKNYFGNIELEFVQPLEKGYEFQFKNDTPSDRIIKKFRINIPLPQKVISKTTKDVYLKLDEKGNSILPGGNMSYVPAAEFKEIDGYTITASSIKKFRVPPLTSRSWIQIMATIVDVSYEIKAKNKILYSIEQFLSYADIYSNKTNIRFLVVDNYWVISESESLEEALRILCRDDDSYAESGCMPIKIKHRTKVGLSTQCIRRLALNEGINAP